MNQLNVDYLGGWGQDKPFLRGKKGGKGCAKVFIVIFFVGIGAGEETGDHVSSIVCGRGKSIVGSRERGEIDIDFNRDIYISEFIY